MFDRLRATVADAAREQRADLVLSPGDKSLGLQSVFLVCFGLASSVQTIVIVVLLRNRTGL